MAFDLAFDDNDGDTPDCVDLDGLLRTFDADQARWERLTRVADDQANRP